MVAWTRPLDTHANVHVGDCNSCPILSHWAYVISRVQSAPWVSTVLRPHPSDLPLKLLKDLSRAGVYPKRALFLGPRLKPTFRFIPDLILYLSCAFQSAPRSKYSPDIVFADFYTKTELPIRLSLFYMSSNVCSIFGGFLAFGVLRMRGVAGRPGWRYATHFFSFRV
jgi:hypothetical protein